MDEQLNLLIGLQVIDGKIRTCVEETNRFPGLIAALERRREESKAGVESVREELETARKVKRERDGDLETGIQKVEKLKARASEIKTNKEYQALLKEIETAEQESKAVEDDILALMEKIDAAAGQITAAEKNAKEEEAAINAEQKQYQAAQAKLEKELKAHEQSKQDAASRIEQSVLEEYQKLCDRVSGDSVVEARAESCLGCHMSIPPQVYVIVKKNNAITTCPNCTRILYYKVEG